MTRQVSWLPTAMVAALSFMLPAQGQAILSDSFERVAGTFGDDDVFPPILATPDWGSFDNALGGSVSPTPYIVSDSGNDNIQSVGLQNNGDYNRNERADGPDFLQWQQELGTVLPDENKGDGADGDFNGIVEAFDLTIWEEFYGGPFGRGELRFGKTILDVNLAGLTEVQNAGGFSVQADINPANIGGGGFNGRDWGGIGIASSGDLADVPNPLAHFLSVPEQSRLSVGTRNSGTLINAWKTAGGDVFNGGGKPGMLTEPIFDQATWDDYVAWFNGGDGTAPGDPVNTFSNFDQYTLRIEVQSDFTAGAASTARVFVGKVGEPLSELDLNDNNTGNGITPVSFTWGADEEAYIHFFGNGATHTIDNLIIDTTFSPPALSSLAAVPEPTGVALLALVWTTIATFRRRSRGGPGQARASRV